MTYKGHIENGSIVLDEPATLREGARVQIELIDSVDTSPAHMALRGTPCVYEDPFTPALDADDWDAAR